MSSWLCPPLANTTITDFARFQPVAWPTEGGDVCPGAAGVCGELAAKCPCPAKLPANAERLARVANRSQARLGIIDGSGSQWPLGSTANGGGDSGCSQGRKNCSMVSIAVGPGVAAAVGSLAAKTLADVPPHSDSIPEPISTAFSLAVIMLRRWRAVEQFRRLPFALPR
jgi:hypothetical protein